MNIYTVQVIRYDEKGKKSVETDEVTAASYENDDHNNLVFYDEYNEFITMYHGYNWIQLTKKLELIKNTG